MGVNSTRGSALIQGSALHLLPSLFKRAFCSFLQALPANWPNNHESIGMKGSAFLLPTVTKEDAEKYFPGFKTCAVPSGVEYLRLTKIEDLK
jgi:hypothetical protein